MVRTFTVERGLRLVAGAFVLASVVLGVYVSPWFLAFTAFVGANLLQSAFTNWCPMMAFLRKAGFQVVLLGLLLAAPAAAQTTDAGSPGGTVAVIGGGAITSSTGGALVGGTVVYDLNDWIALEGSGAWFDRGPGADALTLTGSMLVNLLPLGRTAVPYAAIGGGMYRASFDLGRPQIVGPLPFTGQGWGSDQMPHFYARRLGMMAMPAGGFRETRAFTDPALTFGGGLRLNVAPHLEIRPDARAIVAFQSWDSYTVGVFGVNIGYRF